MRTKKPRKSRIACINCGKKYCVKENSICRGCFLKLRIEAANLETERRRIIDHYEEHAVKHDHQKGRISKKRYQLFIATKKLNKKGFTWFERGDISLGYPSISTNCYNSRTKKFELGIEVTTYSFRFRDLGNYGKYLVGCCVIGNDAVQWLEGNYEQLAKEALEKEKAKALK